MDNIIYNTAKSGEELEESHRLVCREYAKDDYIFDHGASLQKFLSFILLPDSVTFTARKDGRIIGTISVIADSEIGLPMDEIYKDGVDSLRKHGKKIAEISQLAIDREYSDASQRGNKAFLFIPLFKMVFDYSMRKKFDNLCVAVNPKHSSVYNSLFFNDIGGLKYYPSVNNAPAIAKTLDLNRLKRELHRENFKSNTLFNLILK